MSDLAHVHYCKDVKESEICFARGYCECKCGARSPLSTSEATEYGRKWSEPAQPDAAGKETP